MILELHGVRSIVLLYDKQENNASSYVNRPIESAGKLGKKIMIAMMQYRLITMS